MNTSNKPSSYASFQSFAPTLNEKIVTDPIAWSLYGNSLNAQFSIGAAGQNKYGPQGEKSQLYMAERCSLNFDGVCEMVSRDQTILRSNVASIRSPSFPASDQIQTVGQALLDNAGQRRFGDLSWCNLSKQKFNDQDPNSPYVTSISSPNEVPCYPPQNPDQDRLLNRILDEPEAHMVLLTNMYKNTRKNKDAYKGTRIGKFFDVIETYLRS